MKPFPAPTAPGHYWAKLVHPTGMPEGEDWQSLDFEVVQVWDNNSKGDQKWGVSVPGVDVTQWVEDFVWGPKVEAPAIPGLKERPRVMPRLFPKPTVPGHYWSKMICKHPKPTNEWEVVQVDETFKVWAIGAEFNFEVDDFEWGPRVMPPFDGPTGTVADISDDDLLRRAVRSARSTRYSVGAPHPRWVAVKDALALGRTYSAQLCERFGFDPDEKVKR